MATELTPEAQQELKNVKQVVEKNTANAVLSQAERDEITIATPAHSKVTFEELEVVMPPGCDKIASGELQAKY